MANVAAKPVIISFIKSLLVGWFFVVINYTTSRDFIYFLRRFYGSGTHGIRRFYYYIGGTYVTKTLSKGGEKRISIFTGQKILRERWCNGSITAEA
jgi:hypothetical protein